MTLEEFKTKLINFCHEYWREGNLKEYSIVHQINILAGNNGTDKEEYDAWVIARKDEYAVIESDINALQNTDLYDNFQTDSDANMMTYVAGYLPNLTTDRQKLAVIIGIQSIY